MAYTDITTLITDAITGISGQALLILGAVVVVAGGLFLFKWGFKKAKRGFNGNV